MSFFHRKQPFNQKTSSIFAGKVFSITYIRLKFQSSRPESFAIYKKTNEDGQWIPYQYYSASCEETYNRPKRDIITRDDETKAICTDVYSDISPLTGGGVVFSTLEGRPSAYNFENSPVLQVRYYDIIKGNEGMTLVARPVRNGTGYLFRTINEIHLYLRLVEQLRLCRRLGFFCIIEYE